MRHLALSLLRARNEKIEKAERDCVCVAKSAAPSADRALRHRGCTIEVPGSCFPAIAGTGPVARSGPPKLAERRTSVIILIQLNVPNFVFSSEKRDPMHHLALSRLRARMKKTETRNVTAFMWGNVRLFSALSAGLEPATGVRVRLSSRRERRNTAQRNKTRAHPRTRAGACNTLSAHERATRPTRL